MLTFVIPTNNRAKELEVCIRSIADQIIDGCGGQANIIIIDDGCTDSTPELVEQLGEDYGCITYCRYDKHDDYSDVFRTMFTVGSKSEWVWTFGDDDYLEKGALKFMLGLLEKEKERPGEERAQFFHVAEKSRASGSSGAFRGALIDLCQNFGLIEMTGFITGNICKGMRLGFAADTPRWKEYAKSSFVQSFALLEEFMDGDNTAVFLDIPLISTQYADQTAETIERWGKNQIAARYLFVATATQRMFDDGILTEKLNPKFFRYLTYHLWDRFLTFMPNDYVERGQVWGDDAWANIARFATFINDQAISDRLVADVELVRGMTTLHFYMKQNLDAIMATLAEVPQRRGVGFYPWTFVEPPTAPVADEPAQSGPNTV